MISIIINMIDISGIYNRRNASIGVLQSAYHRLVMFVSNKYLPSRRRPSKTQDSSANNIAIPSTYVDGVFLHRSLGTRELEHVGTWELRNLGTQDLGKTVARKRSNKLE